MQPPRKARVLLVALCLGCQVLGCQTPTIWIDPEADFSRYRTWTMRAVPAEARDDEAGAVDPVLYLLVAAALARELDARGYSTSALAAPDLLVSYRVRVTLERESSVVAIPKTVVAPSGQGYTATHTREVVVDYEKGRTEIEVRDALRHEIVWRGEATARVRSSFAHEIDSIVEKDHAELPDRPPERLSRRAAVGMRKANASLLEIAERAKALCFSRGKTYLPPAQPDGVGPHVNGNLRNHQATQLRRAELCLPAGCGSNAQGQTGSTASQPRAQRSPFTRRVENAMSPEGSVRGGLVKCHMHFTRGESVFDRQHVKVVRRVGGTRAARVLAQR